MKIKYFFYLFLALSVYNCSSCDPIGQEKCKKNVSFEIQMSLSPELDTFSLGDTIWVESTINRKLLDLKSGDSIFVDTFDFKIHSGIDKYIDTTNIYFGENSFDYVNHTGKFIVFNSNISTALLLYKKDISGQNIKFGMIPKETGNFIISFYNLRNDLVDINIPEECQINISDFKYRMNQGENNNYHLVDSFYHIIYPNSNYDENDFNHDGGYAFVVIE